MGLIARASAAARRLRTWLDQAEESLAEILPIALRGALASGLSVMLPVSVFGLVYVPLSEATVADFGATILLFTVVGVPCGFIAALLYGLPIYLIIRKLRQPTRQWLVIFGAIGGFIIKLAWFGIDKAFDEWLSPLFFCGQGVVAALAFWYGAERWAQGKATRT